MNHLSFHYFLWGNSVWYTSAVDYTYVSGTNYARKPRYHCMSKNLVCLWPDFSSLSLGFNPMWLHTRFLEDQAALMEFLQFSPAYEHSIIVPYSSVTILWAVVKLGITLSHPHRELHLWPAWPVVQLLKNLPEFYGIQRFITVSTRCLHWSLSWARSVQSLSPVYLFKIHLNIIHPLTSWSS
jgi:hypothetical protein